MKVIVSEKIFITPENDLEHEIIAKTFRETLVFVDPTAEEKTPSVFGMDKTIALFRFNKKSGCFEIPRGRIDQLEVLKNRGCHLGVIKDERQTGKNIKFKTNFELRDDIQRGAFDAFFAQKDQIGIINLSCGLGGAKAQA